MALTVNPMNPILPQNMGIQLPPQYQKQMPQQGGQIPYPTTVKPRVPIAYPQTNTAAATHQPTVMTRRTPVGYQSPIMTANPQQQPRPSMAPGYPTTQQPQPYQPPIYNPQNNYARETLVSRLLANPTSMNHATMQKMYQGIADQAAPTLQNNIQGIRESLGSRGLGDSGIAANMELQARMGNAANLSDAMRQIQVQGATQNFQDMQNTLNTALQQQTGVGGLNLQQLLGMGEQGLTARGQDIQQMLGMAGEATTQRGQDIQRLLGLTGEETSRRGQDIQQLLGLGEQGLTQRQQDISQMLGLRSQDIERELGLSGLDVQTLLGLGSQGVQRELGLGQIDLSRQLGLGEQAMNYSNMQNDWFNQDREYNMRLANQLFGIGSAGQSQQMDLMNSLLGLAGQGTQYENNLSNQIWNQLQSMYAGPQVTQLSQWGFQNNQQQPEQAPDWMSALGVAGGVAGGVGGLLTGIGAL